MKTVYTLAALFALAAAQDASDIPSCALPCIEDAAAEVTDCSSTDFECLCGEIDAVREEATACVVSECGASTALNEVIPAVEAVCKAVAEGGSGGDDEPEEETPEEETPEEETPEEETPEEETPEEETPEEETPEEEKPEEEKPEEDDHSEHDEPEVYPHPPTNETTVPEPEPEHPETAGAAAAGYMGVAAMVGIVALAL